MLCTKAGAVLPDPRRFRRICPRFFRIRRLVLCIFFDSAIRDFFHKGSAGKLAATSFPAEESSETVTSEEIRASLRHFFARTAAWNNYTQKKKSMQYSVSIKSQCLAWIFLVYPLCRCPCAQGCPAK